MKECEISLQGGLDECNTKPDTECVLMTNEGIPGCSAEAIRNALQNSPMRLLKIYKHAHSPGGRWAERCLASPNIVQVVDSILAERSKKS